VLAPLYNLSFEPVVAKDGPWARAHGPIGADFQLGKAHKLMWLAPSTEGYREKSPFSPPRILSRSFHPPQPLYAWCSTPPVALIGCGHRPG
jgi:hypothetical protein